MINNSNRISFVCFNCKEKNDSCVKGTGDCAFERDNYTNIFELMFKTKYINKWLPTNDMLYGFISSRLVIENVFPYISKAKYPTLSSMLKTTKFEDSMFGCVNPVKKENVSDDEIENIFVELYNLKSERDRNNTDNVHVYRTKNVFNEYSGLKNDREEKALKAKNDSPKSENNNMYTGEKYYTKPLNKNFIYKEKDEKLKIIEKIQKSLEELKKLL